MCAVAAYLLLRS